MKNSDMKPNRFAQWARARKTIAWIKSRLVEGRIVCVTNHMRSTQYKAKHIDMFVAGKNGAYVRHGKKLLCIDGNQISAF
jgi:hypothetical protein